MKRKKSGFTLIELMVVFVIISILAAFLIPNLLSSIEKGRKAKEKAIRKEAIEKTAPSGERPEGPLKNSIEQPGAPQKGIFPQIDSAEVNIRTAASHHRLGMDIFTRYETKYQGRFKIMPPNKEGEEIRLDFSFPQGTTEARDVAMTFEREGKSEEPEGVNYGNLGISWCGKINEPVTVDTSFVTLGRDCFEYHLPPATRMKTVKISMDLSGVSNFLIPDHALQPTSSSEKKLEWQFNNLVTDRSILIEFTGAQTPLGRVMLLSKLVGIAVLLFGIAFWYLADLYRPGLLYHFRMGHFLLLALTYSLFFIILAVLGLYNEHYFWYNAGISAILSLPLLVLHVSRITNFRFAFAITLPAGILTLALVINGVYGAYYRDYIFIGAAFLIIAFLTVTYRRWSVNREQWIKTLEEDLGEKIKALEGKVKEAREAEQASTGVLAMKNFEDFPEIQEEVKRVKGELLTTLTTYEKIIQDYSRMLSTSPGADRNSTRKWVLEKTLPMERYLALHTQNVKNVLEKLHQARQRQRSQNATAKDAPYHCIFCGTAMQSWAFCPHCGTRQPKKIQCRKCEFVLPIPVHLISGGLKDQKMHCPSCGDPLSI